MFSGTASPRLPVSGVENPSMAGSAGMQLVGSFSGAITQMQTSTMAATYADASGRSMTLSVILTPVKGTPFVLHGEAVWETHTHPRRASVVFVVDTGASE